MAIKTLRFWRVRDPISGRIIKTRYRATEEDIKRAHQEAEPVFDGTEIIIDDAEETPAGSGMGHFQGSGSRGR